MMEIDMEKLSDMIAKKVVMEMSVRQDQVKVGLLHPDYPVQDGEPMTLAQAARFYGRTKSSIIRWSQIGYMKKHTKSGVSMYQKVKQKDYVKGKK
jgi:hypothetical protein